MNYLLWLHGLRNYGHDNLLTIRLCVQVTRTMSDKQNNIIADTLYY